MSVLDLQDLEESTQTGYPAGGSSGSGHSCPSNLSALLCGGGSGLSVTLCH